MKFHASKPWSEITKALKGAKKRRIAVTAYLQTGAREMLPLKSGDMLVVNASEMNVRSGSTNPSEIEKFRKNRVKCYSVADLHAKVYVADDRAFVGSANATTNSLTVLAEACLEVKEAEVVGNIEDWVQTLALVPLTEDELARLAGIYRPPIWGSRSVKGPRTWITWVSDDATDEESEEYDAHVATLRRDLNKRTSGIFSVGGNSQVFRSARPGDEVYVVDLSQKPAVVYGRRVIDNSFEEERDDGTWPWLDMEDPKGDPSMSYSEFRSIAKRLGLEAMSATKEEPDRRVNASIAAALRKACKACM
jgi:hypothetical protein